MGKGKLFLVMEIFMWLRKRIKVDLFFGGVVICIMNNKILCLVIIYEYFYYK